MRNGKQHGFTYLSLIILVTIIGLASAATIKLGVILQRSAAERELLAIGAEYADALESYAKATPPGQSPLPRSFKELLRDPRFPNVRRHLRRIYVDPLTGKAEWGIVYANNAQGNPQAQQGTGTMPPAAPGAPGGPGALASPLGGGMAHGAATAPGAGGAASLAQPAMQPLQGGTAGIVAFYSLSTAKPVKVGNFPARFQGFENRAKISDWKFARAEAQNGQPPTGQPQQPQQPGQPLQPGQSPQPGQPPVTPPPEAPSEPPVQPAVPPGQPQETPDVPPADAQPQRHGEEPAPEEPPQEAQPDQSKSS